ncbi:MAG: nitrogen regulation protein NR(II) [Gammaproteobacteria bacterium]|jgi:two-component system nitrogen regulation sensor histidine kinase GlnL|nr:nitrogen regulation protein NR(II) [Gammaproteobacteria bacterium]MBK7519405.1 nitrogen regulation protein NR(II) [Gammaproteobacteria bacterium]MBK7729846.1 nitrogen regulation protein NR(II) [Gammaproteobacteria bacterium]MBK8305690.1 nitrogen regulation protein NR(II) [Gammaproteobacteria bacterium]MBP6052634.1 nitrogen regulation protein NR(II) [Pseudomonadales bacterium]
MPLETLHTRLLDNLTTAILLVAADMRVSYLNTAAESLLELSSARVLGENVQNVFHEDENTVAGLRRALETGTGFTKRQTVFHLGTGHDITVDYAVTPAWLENESLIIEIQPLDRMMRFSRDEAILSSQHMTQSMVRGLAHEIKNPLGGLRGAAQLLARELDSEQLLDYTNVIIEEADRLGNLVDRMLSAPRRLQREAVNIHEVLERVRHLVEAESHGALKIRRDYDPSIPELSGDREQLIQAVLNVVRNAQQVLAEQPTGAPPPIIELRTRTVRQFTIGNQRHRLACQIDVSDNGPGVPPELIDTLFFPMISGRAEGTGLGLAIAQSIISQHHGLIECSSRPGHTTFSILLPLEYNHD